MDGRKDSNSSLAGIEHSYRSSSCSEGVTRALGCVPTVYGPVSSTCRSKSHTPKLERTCVTGISREKTHASTMSVHMAFHPRGCFASFSLFPSAAPFPLSSWARMHLYTPMMDGRSVQAQSATAGSLKFRVSFFESYAHPR